MAQFENIDFPGWEVVRKIGEGSFGGVYEIHRTLPSGRVEKCALKKLAVPKDNGEIQELISQSFSMESITAHYKNQMGELVNEYSLTQELNSCKNVVGCYDVRFIQHDDGIGWDIYIRMELLNPLREALSAEYQEDTVLRLGLDMCNALLACQEHSIIHRDIKPENILVSDRGEFKLGDFGIAKVSERTGTGTMTGTTGYMAPEVANRQHYGAQADIYSLGMVLYWMMNRRTLPFLPYPPAIPSAIQRQEAANRRLAGEPFPPPVNGSRELKAIVMKACAYSTAERYQSVQELHQALSACTQPPLIHPQEPTILDIPRPEEPTQDSTVGAFEGIQSKNELPKLAQPVASPNKRRENAPRKKKSFKWLWIPVCLLLIGSGVFGIKQVMNTSPTSKYRAAQELLDAKNYSSAAKAFEALGDYSDSAEKAQEARQMQEQEKKEQSYQSAQKLLDAKNYSSAAKAFEALGDYSDSAEKAQEARQIQEQEKKEQSYQSAQKLLDAKDYSGAAKAFEALGDYSDSPEKAQEARQMQEQEEKEQSYQAAQALLDAKDYSAAAEAFAALGNYSDSAAKEQGARRALEQEEKENAYRAAQTLMDEGNYSAAAEAFAALGSYTDSTSKLQEARRMQQMEADYQSAQALMDDGKYMQAMWAFSNLNYGDSQEKAQEAKECYLATQRTPSLAAGNNHTVGLRSNGTVVAVGAQYSPNKCAVEEWKNIVAVAAGYDHTLGLRGDGTVITAGLSTESCEYPGVSDVASWRNIIAVATNTQAVGDVFREDSPRTMFHAIGLRSDGTVVAAGDNDSGQCNVSDWKNIVAITTDPSHTVGLCSNGAVVAVGNNDNGQCNVNSWEDIVAVSAGAGGTIGLRSDGTVVTAGINSSIYDVSGWTDIIAISAGLSHIVGLRSDGTVVATGENHSGEYDSGKCNVGTWRDIVAVAAGGGHTVGLRSDGSVVATGLNYEGECNVTGWKNIRTP